jgi:RHS repeat-associated protein
MLIPNRFESIEDYRYGFNGIEKDDEVKGEGNSYDYGNRMYDPRIGRWLKTDYYESKYPSTSSYAFALNNPIYLTDHVGDSVKVHISNIKVGEVKINLYSASEIKKDATLKSKQRVVPVYKVTVTNQSTKNEFVFYYTRDAFRGQTDGSEKEVTFNVINDGDKFLGKVKSRWKGTDNVLELRAFDNIDNQTIHGMKAGIEADRTAIQLHVLGASDGCLLAVGSGQFETKDDDLVTTSIATNSSGSQMNFMNKVKEMLNEDKNWNCSEVIVVEFDKVTLTTQTNTTANENTDDVQEQPRQQPNMPNRNRGGNNNQRQQAPNAQRDQNRPQERQNNNQNNRRN